MRNNKAVSPLVATVLLVAIVVVIAFLVFWWYGEFIGENLEKSKVTASQACVQEVSFSVSNRECNDGPSLDDKIVSFSVENNGNIRLSSFKANVEGNKEKSFVEDIAQGVAQGVSSKVSFLVDVGEYGTQLDVEVIPMISAGGTTKYCSDQSQMISVSCV